MKSVRYVIGAVGVAPALGLMIPAANAAAAVTHTPKNAAKTVSAKHGKAPSYTCGSGKISGAFSPHGRYHAAINYSGINCIHHQYASLNFAKTGLTERVRFYSGGGKLEHSTFLGGKSFIVPMVRSGHRTRISTRIRYAKLSSLTTTTKL